MRGQQQHQQPVFKGNDAMDWLYVFLSAHALCLVVFIRHSFGAAAMGMSGIVAALMILCYGAFTNDPALFTFFWVWLAAVAVQRVITAVRTRRGWVAHSQCFGYPWLGMRLARRERRAKSVAEPLICFAVGSLVAPWSTNLAAFFIVGCFSLLLKLLIERMVMERRARMVRDARIEQQMVSDQVRNGDDW